MINLYSDNIVRIEDLKTIVHMADSKLNLRIFGFTSSFGVPKY